MRSRLFASDLKMFVSLDATRADLDASTTD